MANSNSSPPDSKIQQFRSVFEGSLADVAARTNASKRCLILSGGVDTCAILAAARKLGIEFKAAVTVVTGDNDEESPDGRFSKAAAEEHGLEHHVIRLTAKQLVETYLPHCVKVLATFDGMTLRNSLVVAAAFQKATGELGCDDVVVGDGADELFGGYSFMWGSEDDTAGWKQKRDDMCRNWTFATDALAKSYGLTAHSPYMETGVVDWALKNTGRAECIGTHPIRLVHGGEMVSHVTGKVILRKAYDTPASWRRKDPIEVGSGVTKISRDDFWYDIISDKEFEEAIEDAKKRGFVIKNKEHLINFRSFEEQFLDSSGIWYHPTKKRLRIGEGCVGCCFEINNKFCHICGAWPAYRGDNP